MSDLWKIPDEQLSKALGAYYAVVRSAREAHRAAILAHGKAVEAADLVVECRQAQVRFARKQLLFTEVK